MARIIDYPRTPSHFPSYVSPNLWEELEQKGVFPHCKVLADHMPFNQNASGDWYSTLKSRYDSTVRALGPFAGDLFLFVHITSSLQSVKEDLAPLYPGLEDPDAEKRQGVEKVLALLDVHKARFSTEGEALPHGWISPKLLALRNLLQKQDINTFRGMVFAAERQIATTISLLIPRLGLPGIKVGPLVGHGQKVCSEPTQIGMKGMSFRAQENIVEDFRRGRLNLLIATSVAEEGLDFPLCSFVCRFDPPKTLPQYIQSRGRARQAGSSFIIMLEEGPTPERGKVEMLQIGEGLAKNIYGQKMDRLEDNSLDDDLAVDVDDFPEDRLVIEKTGASLTPADAISLLNNLCSLIPHDQHTRPLVPKYKIDPMTFRCEVILPSALPVPRDQLLYHSTPSRSKRAAKRSAAFNAVKGLYCLEVFDDYLLPIRRGKGDTVEDVDGKLPIDISSIEPLMEVLVHDAWGDVWESTSPLFFHTISIAGQGGMAVVCAQRLRSYEGNMMARKELMDVRLSDGVLLELEQEEKLERMVLMDKFTKQVIKVAITRKGLTEKSSVFLVPLDPAGFPDWDAMNHSTCTPASTNWRAIYPSESPDIIISLKNESKPSRLVASRPDLVAAECVAKDPYLSKIVAYNTDRGIDLPEDDLVYQCRPLLQMTSTEFRDPNRQKSTLWSEQDIFLPQSLCRWMNMSHDTISFFSLLPPLTHLLSSVYRARILLQKLKTPRLDLDRTIEAFTLPSANASFNNQRLETLGDSFLKVATTIHVYNRFPFKHEGQLSYLRQNSVCNRYLLGRGHVLDLPSFMTIEPNSQRTWRLTTKNTTRIQGEWLVKRTIPRRSVQDCMEALIGAAWLSGGEVMALDVGTKLGLCFGGIKSWQDRYTSVRMDVDQSSPFPALEESLGYQFKNKSLLVEAVTHPSFAHGGASYQRLEFLGDAILDFVTMDYFFNNYPTATSAQLSRARARCVCNPTLAAIATKKLAAHKVLFSDSISLIKDMSETARMFASMEFTEIVDDLWRLDAPKALGDVVEALLGAVFVDSNWEYSVVKRVVIHLLDEVLGYVHPDMPMDPTSEFLLWVAKRKCTEVTFRKDSSSPEIAPRKDQVSVVVHGVDVGSPTIIKPKTTPALGRAMASSNARQLLEDPTSEFFFDKLCTCTIEEKERNPELYQAAIDLTSDEADINLETVEGFATASQDLLIREATNVESTDLVEEVSDPDERDSDSDDTVVYP
ncbi:Dicer-like protein 1 [Serendipita sp. 397]|nr:Dicer-like protein 1 [Serendipita sp. 397]